MKRSQILLSLVAALLLVVGFYALLFQPAREEAAALEAQVAAEQQQHARLNQEIERLRAVRERAPEVEAELAAAEAIVPREAALPSALRQLQLAADDAGVILRSVSTSPPLEVPDAPAGLSAITVNVQLIGGYFQLVDFLRRAEDPTITPRGVAWKNATFGIGDYPQLDASITGEMYAAVLQPLTPGSTPAGDAGAAGESAGGLEVEAELDVDAEVQQ